MACRPEWIEHKGQSILYLGCSEAEEADVLAGMDDVERMLLAMPKGRNALLLLDMSGVRPSIALTQRGDALVKACQEAGVPELPTALVGPERWQKTITKTYLMFRREKNIFIGDSVAEAKDWLVEYAANSASEA